MELAIELGIQLAEKAIESVVRIVNDSKEHTAEEKAALIASITLRLGTKQAEVAAVTFKEV